MRHQKRSDAELRSLEITVAELKRLLLEMAQEHCDSGMYNMKYYLLDQIVEDTQRYKALSILGSSPDEHFKRTPS